MINITILLLLRIHKTVEYSFAFHGPLLSDTNRAQRQLCSSGGTFGHFQSVSAGVATATPKPSFSVMAQVAHTSVRWGGEWDGASPPAASDRWRVIDRCWLSGAACLPVPQELLQLLCRHRCRWLGRVCPISISLCRLPFIALPSHHSKRQEGCHGQTVYTLFFVLFFFCIWKKGRLVCHQNQWSLLMQPGHGHAPNCIRV